MQINRGPKNIASLLVTVLLALAGLLERVPAEWQPWLLLVVMALALSTGNWKDRDGDGDIDLDDVRMAGRLLLVGALGWGLSACGGGLQAPNWLHPAFDSVRLCTDGAADVDASLGDLPLMRLKSDGAACAEYDWREGPSVEAEACATLDVGPFRERVFDTCASAGTPVEGSGAE